jgi:hypothetical protein
MNTQMIALACALFCGSLCHAQNDVIEDFSGSGGVSSQTAPPRRYDANIVGEMSLMTVNLNTLLEISSLTIGQTYTFTIEFTNTLDKPVMMAEVKTACACEQPSWSTNTIAPGGKRLVTLTIMATAQTEAPMTSWVTLFLQDPSGTIPIAVQQVQLTYQAG